MFLSEQEILKNLQRGDEYRAFLKRRRAFLENEAESPETELEELVTDKKKYAAVMSSMWRIEPEEQKILLAHYVEKRKAHEISKDMDISESTFWRRMRQARRSLTRECRREL